MHVKLHQRHITYCLEAVDLARLDNKDVARTAFERLAIHRPDPATLTDELDLIVRMPVWTRSRAGLPMEQKHRNRRITLLCSNKLIRTADKWQVLMTNVMHALSPE